MQTIKQYSLLLFALFVMASPAACGSSEDTDKDTESEKGDAGDAGDAGQGGDDQETETIGDVTLKTIEADDERIQYTGRIDFTNPKEPKFSAAGTYIKIRFRGVSLSVIMEDEIRYDERQSFMDVLIDDNTPVVIEPDMEKKKTKYEIADDLPYGDHEVTVVKRVQAENGQVTFLGFEIGGELLDPPSRPTRRIQIVGDSIAAGEGSDVDDSSECTGVWLEDIRRQNARRTFGPILADSLEADYHLIAWSGKGLYQNYDDTYDARLMPELYELLFMELDPSPQWDPDLFVPDAILIELGTNDFGAGVSGERPAPDIKDFADAYIDFVDTLLGYYPDVEVFALSSALLGDEWPDPEDTRRTDLEDALSLVETHYKDQDIDQVHAINVSKVSAQGCNGHPSGAEHEEMAAEIEDPIREVMGW